MCFLPADEPKRDIFELEFGGEMINQNAQRTILCTVQLATRIAMFAPRLQLLPRRSAGSAAHLMESKFAHVQRPCRLYSYR